MNVATMLAAHAARHPDKTAFVCEGDVMNFSRLEEDANRIASALRDRGLAPGDRVVVYVGNSLGLVALIAGIWRVGAIAVPVSTWITAAELRFMVDDCTPAAVAYGSAQQPAVAEALGARSSLQIFIGNDPPDGTIALDDLIGEGDPSPRPPLNVDDDDAMISYTSGTTGQPKGAIITHANLINQSTLTAALWPVGGDDTYLVTTPIAHRTGLARLISTFCLGATVIALPRFDAEAAVAAIADHGVTAFGGVPTTVRLMLDALGETGSRCDSLRTILATGEPFPVPLKERLFARLPRVQLISFYAMTEAGSPACLWPDQQLSHPSSVGRPMPGMEIRLVDENGRNVETGEPGEIQVRAGKPGEFVIMRGYYNRPEANAEAFVGDWFRTGDVARFDEDGFLYIVDRVKDMILSGGLNIYSREVEHALDSHPAVAEASVVAGPDSKFGECVVAFVVPRAETSVDADALIDHCRSLIASYKKPKHVVFVEQLPRNPTGKVLKTELRERARHAIEGD